MNEKNENYTAHIAVGLIITILVIVGLAIYTLNEPERLALAQETFLNEREERGAIIYEEQCSSCHGGLGEGGIGPAINDRDLLKGTQDEVFFSIIRSGVPGTVMPAWSIDFGGPLTDEDVRDVVAFVRAWESTAPVIEAAVLEPDASQGALLFASTCAVCHGEFGEGTDIAPAINDPDRLSSLDDDWYRGVIRNGRPARGMPTWGTVLSPMQVEDLVALIGSWREGVDVQPDFSVTELLDRAIYSLNNGDAESAALQVARAMTIAQGAGLEILRNAASQLASGDEVGALTTLEALRAEWPIGDPTVGAQVYSTYCAACHGPQGEGGIGPQLNPSEFIQSMSNADLVEFIQVGRPGTAMAGFADRLLEPQIADLVAFVRMWQP
jgi:mono/diheme cytochrome c family protein